VGIDRLALGRSGQVVPSLVVERTQRDRFGTDFVSAIPNAGAYHEFKTPFNEDMSFECKTSTLLPKDGVVEVPTGPGLGIDFDPAFIDKHEVVGA
jgi:L-alanine-DL-glutamate epimerase-like enolase superfamily enzyme